MELGHEDRDALRRPRTPRFGREAELARVEAAFVSGERLVTLTGPGGSGKTRLAVDLARDTSRRQTSVRWIDLGGARTLNEGLACIASGLDLEATRHQVLARRAETPATQEIDHGFEITVMGRQLATRGETLIVLDQVDWLVPALGRVLDRWLDLAPASRFLVTTRERLGLDGERVIALGSLGAEGIRLFLDRAERSGADTDYAPQERRALEDLVERLDGLPLAIELAAARADLLTPVRLVTLLDRRFDLLRASSPHSPHAGMREAVAFSWDLLDPPLQAVLECLAVLANPFDLALAAATAGLGETEALVAVTTLGRRSLLVMRGEQDLRLFETVRDFARERAELSGRAAVARGRRDTHLVVLAELRLARSRRPARPGDPAETGLVALEALGRMRGQLVLAAREARERGAAADAHGLRAGLALLAFLRRVGLPWAEPDLFADIALVASELDLDLRVRASLLTARVALDLGRDHDAEAAIQRAAAAVGEATADRAHADILLHRGRLAYERNELELAHHYFAASAKLAASIDAPEIEGLALANLAVADASLDPSRARTALDALSKADQALRRAGAYDLLPFQRGMTFFVANRVGQQARAREALAEGMTIARSLGLVRDEAGLQGQLGLAELERGNLGVAADHLEHAVVQAGAANVMLALRCSILLAWVYLERGRPDLATAVCERIRSLIHSPLRPRESESLDTIDALRLAMSGEVDGARLIAARVSRGDANLSLVGRAVLAIVAQARAPSESGESPPEVSELTIELASGKAGDGDVRRAAALLTRAMAARRHDPTVLVIAPDRTSFRFGAEWEDLSQRQTLQRLFAALVDARLDQPGMPLDAAKLGDIGWPNEKMLPEARANRLHVTLSKLRKSGLEDVIERGPGGWHLNTTVPLFFAAPSAWP